MELPKKPTPGYLAKRIEIRISKRHMHSHVHGSSIHNSQDVKAWKQMSINRGIGKEYLVYAYRKLFSL